MDLFRQWHDSARSVERETSKTEKVARKEEKKFSVTVERSIANAYLILHACVGRRTV